MKTRLLFMVLAFLAAGLKAEGASKSGFGIHGNVGSDFRGVGFGGGASWVAQGGLPWELDATIFISNNTVTAKDSTDPFEYTEKTNLAITAFRANILPGHSFASVSPFFILGGGFALVSLDYDYKERSLSPSYVTNSHTSVKDMVPATVLNIGAGFVTPGGFEGRLEVPTLIFTAYSGGESASVFVPTVAGSVGYRF